MTNSLLSKHSIPSDIHALKPSIMPEQPWWNNLNPNFNQLPDDIALDSKTQFLVNIGAKLDIAARSSLAALLAMKSLPTTFNPQQMSKDIKAGEFYRNLADQHDQQQVFAQPPYIDINEEPAVSGHGAPKGALCSTLTFDSPFQPLNPDMQESYLSNKPNLKARAQYWRHDKNESRPTICVIHGFLIDSYRLNSAMFKLTEFFNKGYDILLYTLPHHGSRQGEESPFSGSHYFSGGLSWLNETILHSIFDFRIFINYLEQRGAPKFGVTGVSLGGYTTSLLACVEKRLSFAIPNVPVSIIADLFMLWNPANRMLKKSLQESGTSLQQMRHTIAIHSPLTYQPVIPKENLMIIAAAGDRCAPPNQARILWDHWGRPNIHWFHGNHAIHLGRKHYLAEMGQFFERIGFIVS